MTNPNQAGDGSEPAFTYLPVPLPPIEDIDHDWCAEFASQYGHQGYRTCQRSTLIFASDVPVAEARPGAMAYSFFELPDSQEEGDKIDGEVVGARLVPNYLRDCDTDELIVEGAELIPHIVLADAVNISKKIKLARSLGDFVAVPLNPEDGDIILYY